MLPGSVPRLADLRQKFWGKFKKKQKEKMNYSEKKKFMEDEVNLKKKFMKEQVEEKAQEHWKAFGEEEGLDCKCEIKTCTVKGTVFRSDKSYHSTYQEKRAFVRECLPKAFHTNGTIKAEYKCGSDVHNLDNLPQHRRRRRFHSTVPTTKMAAMSF